MLVLGIESSCDETAAAVVRDGRSILSNVVASQVETHRAYGGVVPELASRQHSRHIVPVVERALAEAGLEGPSAVDGLAVTHGPGLPGALLVGVQLAKALAYVAGRPLVGVNHLEGHLFAPLLAAGDPPPPRHVALLVSGGHTCLVLVEEPGRYRLLGASRDDAAGEAFDKVAKLLGIGYPGGPAIERLAASGEERAIRFPRPLPARSELDFSFSGLKTAVANWVRAHGVPDGQALADLCASVQRAIVDVLVRKARAAVRARRAPALVAGGGVVANRAVRQALADAAAEDGFVLCLPPPGLCTDNAAMIAAAGAFRLRRGERAGLELGIAPRLPL